MGFAVTTRSSGGGKYFIFERKFSSLQFFCIRYDNDEDESIDVIRRGEGSRWAADISTDYC